VDVRTVHRWVGKQRKMGENLDVNDQTLSGSHVTVTHDLKGQKISKFVQENRRNSQRVVADKSLKS
jgi:hypothetical protein